jgi:SAM-dependent methyltransferase
VIGVVRNLSGRIRSREFTNMVRFVLDECLPPVLRERRLLTEVVARVYLGSEYRHFDVDFKRHAAVMTDEELSQTYLKAAGMAGSRVRDTDLTEGQIRWILEACAGESVLEIGSGSGHLATALARAGKTVTATELYASLLAPIEERARTEGVTVTTTTANAERLPFADASFDTVVAAHTLEHVRHFERAVDEMTRVARERILIVVPRQRYYRYTVDYHLHFFPDPEQLILRAGLDRYRCEIVNGDLCYAGMLS